MEHLLLRWRTQPRRLVLFVLYFWLFVLLCFSEAGCAIRNSFYLPVSSQAAHVLRWAGALHTSRVHHPVRRQQVHEAVWQLFEVRSFQIFTAIGDIQYYLY